MVDRLNETKTQMIGMKLIDAIKLKEVSLFNRESCPPEEDTKTHCLRMDCIITFYNQVKNTTIKVKEQRIGYDLRRLTG